MPGVKESRASLGPAEPQAGLPGIILSYHRIADAEFDPWGMRVAPRMFEQQLSVVRDFGDPMPLRDYVACRGSGGRSRPAIVITFDDGYVDNLTAALPALKDFQIPATIFVSTGYTGNPYFWWEALEHVFHGHFMAARSSGSLHTGPVRSGLQRLQMARRAGKPGSPLP